MSYMQSTHAADNHELQIPDPHWLGIGHRSAFDPSVTCARRWFPFDYARLPLTSYPYNPHGGPAHPPNTIPFYEFMGHGPPPHDCGYPGDIYIDVNPFAPSLYFRDALCWNAWYGPPVHTGPRTLLSRLFSEQAIAHPYFKNGSCFLFAYSRTCADSPGWFSPTKIIAEYHSMLCSGVLRNENGGPVSGRYVLTRILSHSLLHGERSARSPRRAQVASATDHEPAAAQVGRPMSLVTGVDYAMSTVTTSRPETAPSPPSRTERAVQTESAFDPAIQHQLSQVQREVDEMRRELDRVIAQTSSEPAAASADDDILEMMRTGFKDDLVRTLMAELNGDAAGPNSEVSNGMDIDAAIVHANSLSRNTNPEASLSELREHIVCLKGQLAEVIQLTVEKLP